MESLGHPLQLGRAFPFPTARQNIGSLMTLYTFCSLCPPTTTIPKADEFKEEKICDNQNEHCKYKP